MSVYLDLPTPFDESRRARQEHAWLLRAEGKTLAEIGGRLGVCKERARQMILIYGDRVSRSMRGAKWTVDCSPPA